MNKPKPKEESKKMDEEKTTPTGDSNGEDTPQAEKMDVEYENK